MGSSCDLGSAISNHERLVILDHLGAATPQNDKTQQKRGLKKTASLPALVRELVGIPRTLGPSSVHVGACFHEFLGFSAVWSLQRGWFGWS